MEKIRDD